MDKKRKPYQHHSEAMELLLRFLDHKQGAVNREHWGECSSATLPHAVFVREDKKENKLITSYDCQAITVSFKLKRTKNLNARAKWFLTLPSSFLFRSSLFSRALTKKTKSSAKLETECEALSARAWLLFCDRLNKAFYKSTFNIILCFFSANLRCRVVFLYYNNCSTGVEWGVKI